jgi:hypothetical protein
MKQTFPLVSEISRRRAIEAISQVPDGWVVEIGPNKRSLIQNRALWAALTDIAQQKLWCGIKMEPEDWKNLFTAALNGYKMTKGLHGNMVVLGTSTSKMSKEQMSELLESIIAWGVENGVKFSDYTKRIEEDNRGHSE